MSKAKSQRDAISLLKDDHETVKDLFDRFGESESSAEMQKIIDEAIEELKIHATIEEEIFYPAIRERVGRELMDEAREEHHVARMLIAELDSLESDEDRRNAKFKVLAESVKHHIHEEEGEIFPRAASIDMDFEALGDEMMQRQDELRSEGVLPDAEHYMVAGAHAGTGGRVSREKTAVAGGRMSNPRTGREKVNK